MFVSGMARGNAPQLGSYLLKERGTRRIIILDVDGRPNADPSYFKDFMQSIELNSELTKAKHSVYHGIINPDPNSQRDRAMTMDEWHQASKILAKSLPFKQQRRATILHEDYDGRFHGHVIFERYDLERGIMIDHPFNYKAHDKARVEMEREFGHKHTPQKNLDQPKHKKALTQIWKETRTGQEFVQEARKHGYQVAKGTDRPFRVVDENGRSFDLTRQLEGIRTKEVKERLGNVPLMEDKQAIAYMNSLKQDKPAIEHTQPTPTPKVIAEDVPQQKEQHAKEQADRERQIIIEQIKAEKERNRSRNITRDFMISALLMLRVLVDRYFIADRHAWHDFQANKTEVVATQLKYNERLLGFIEAAQFYKPT